MEGNRAGKTATSILIGVGVTTHNRRPVFIETLRRIREHLPEGARLVVVDDGSAVPWPDATHRFEQPAGIARAKNKCLELLDGCEHVFLFDDDTFPLVDGWWKPYVESPFPHLMRIFLDLSGRRKIRDISVVYDDGEHVAYTGARGAMLYAHRSVIERVGGLDPGYGRWGYEHVDWSTRVHNAGLTLFPFTDVAGSDALIWCEDEHERVDRSVGDLERQRLVPVNRARYKTTLANRDSRYIEYREPRDVVITSLLTKRPDPQRGTTWAADASVLDQLHKSVLSRSAAEFVVLHDELSEVDTVRAHFGLMPTGIQPYFQRHVNAFQYLADRPWVRNVWCVDGSDVEMLRDPFPHMVPGGLYLGYEPTVVADPWMLKEHRAKHLQAFMSGEHAQQPLLNAGLIGGSRELVLSFLHDLIREYADQHARVFHREDKHDLGVGDMAALNYVAYTRYADRLRTGPGVCTLFRAEQSSMDAPHAWWRHK